ncbi:hypothetical protein ABPG75_007454 [Micractinium tetrahymenae]
MELELSKLWALVRRRLRDVAVFLTLSFWIAGFIIVSLWWITDIFLVFRWPKIAIGGLLFKLALLAVPLRIEPPGFVHRFLRFSLVAAHDYFPVNVVWEAEAKEYDEGPFVIGYEPHSVLPQGICMFSEHTEGLPKGLRNVRILASSAAFWEPVMRNMWWWWGVRPVSRECFATQLKKGRSVALCPGGVQECLFMQPGGEVVYLKKRKGFVRMALQHGAALVPCFAFGQSRQYKYCRIFLDWPKHVIPRASWSSFVRRIGYVPLLISGWMGTMMPKKVAMTIVVGRLIRLPKLEEPTNEQVEKYLEQFIAAVERLFDEHKAAAGHADTELTVY